MPVLGTVPCGQPQNRAHALIPGACARGSTDAARRPGPRPWLSQPAHQIGGNL